MLQFSPHAWGWSAVVQGGTASAIVFPTRVGMVRCCLPGRKRAGRFPHTRGDGPTYALLLEALWGFSPHAWGWSAMRPTVVGESVGFPHTRGDGPNKHGDVGTITPFSPHAWGWSGGGYCYLMNVTVFPTRVGMVRGSNAWEPVMRGFPHTRGDGPFHLLRACVRRKFSPHAWGWSGQEGDVHHFPSVFPTRVGMVRNPVRIRSKV